MAKFDLHQLLSERSKAAAVEREKEPRTADGMEQLTLDVYDLIPSQENFYSTQYINDLKQSIAIVGLLQPLLVERDGDKFCVVAGHRRRLACMALVEDGLAQFRRVPCVTRAAEEEGTVKTILDRLALIFANGFREKSDWEKMEETLRTEALIAELRKEVEVEGRTRWITAEFTGITEAQIGRYKSIKNNLCPELMQAFKAKRLGVSTAYELSGLSPDYQARAADTLEEMGVLSINDAKALKQEEEARKPLEGQMELDAAEEGAAQTAKEAAQDAPEAAGDTDTATAAEGTQDTPETAQDGQQEKQQDKPPQKEPEKPVYVEREPRGRGCAWCNPDYHREQATAEGRFLLAYEPEEKLAMILDKETGAVEHMIFHCCPFCGRKLK
ncbi:ParB/RepB/Spo0J family partition protein [Oscillibacter sp. CU971]|uniref:ParB/RepB/Spo0J family partition protein n=1 Tax=Oscillibacter sp. CU971 TaxID=2780102 RepID=UPI0019565730|nr:ParB/RepB/Spo0J family partition protein [Oscillibacter sp. CU971]